MTKKVKISLLTLVWSIVAVQMFVNYKEQMKYSERAVTAFSVVDENITGETIQGYAYFGKMELSEKMKKRMLENFALKMGIKDGYTFSKGQGDGFVKMILTKEGKFATTQVQIISLDAEQNPEQHISVQIGTAADVSSAYELYERLKQVFEEIGVSGQVSLEVEIEQDGDLRKGDEEYIENIFELIDAREVQRLEEDEICTVYGYNKLEKNHLVLDGNKINVQIVMSYDEKEDKTYIKLGMPIVNTSY